MRGSALQKAMRICSLAITGLLLIVLIALLASALMFRHAKASPSLFGNVVFIMSTQSMGNSVPQNSAVIATKPQSGEYEVNDVVLYTKPDGYKAVHRIESVVREEDGVSVFSVKGDANDFAEPELVYATDIIARVDYYSVAFGSFIVFATSLTGVICIVVLPCLMIVLLEVYHIFRSPAKRWDGSDEEDDAGLDNADEDDIADEKEQDEAPSSYDQGLAIRPNGEAEYRAAQDVDPFEKAKLVKNPTTVRAAEAPSASSAVKTVERPAARSFTFEHKQSEKPDKDKEKISVDDILAYIDHEEITLRFDDEKKK